MAKDRLYGRLVVILHADIAGSTMLVQQDKELAHERIRDSFQRFSDTVETYQGRVLEIRGDALLASFDHASDAVSAALSFQASQFAYIDQLQDSVKPGVRVGISVGEVIVADKTVTGPGVVQAQRIEQLAKPGQVYISAAIHDALSRQMPFDLESFGEQVLKGFEHPVHVYRISLKPGAMIPQPAQAGSGRVAVGKRKKIAVSVFVLALITAASLYWLKLPDLTDKAEFAQQPESNLPDKPSIAVLPFTNMSSDPEQDYFTDGMTEDLITDLSKLSGLFVISRNTVFTYKDKAVNIRRRALRRNPRGHFRASGPGHEQDRRFAGDRTVAGRAGSDIFEGNRNHRSL
jgi:class 3 adenylate cyclase